MNSIKPFELMLDLVVVPSSGVVGRRLKTLLLWFRGETDSKYRCRLAGAWLESPRQYATAPQRIKMKSGKMSNEKIAGFSQTIKLNFANISSCKHFHSTKEAVIKIKIFITNKYRN